MVIFAPQNIIMDPPFTKLDLISCRNILIYMTLELQKKLMPLLHYALNPGGILFLGTSETVGSLSELFFPVDNKWRIFRRKEQPSAMMDAAERPLLLLSHRDDKMQRTEKVGKGTELAISDMAQRILLENFTPPAVIINEQGDIVYINGRTGKYLEPAAGKTNMNIYAMSREGLRIELAGAVRKANIQKAEITIKGLKVKTNGDYQDIDLTVKPFREPDAMRGLLMVVFEEVGTLVKPAASGKTKVIPAANQRQMVKELEKEIAYTKEHLQTTVEEMETSQEELKSANEELQSTNEELQSTNEELTTSREELQSMNEDLVTVNSEMHGKIEELARANNDMQNLLNNVEIATIFLDNGLNVKRFTSQATKIINLIPTDIGRSVTHIVSNLKYECVVEDVKAVLHTLIFKEAQVQTKDDRWYLMCIMPYKTLDNIIDGVVITFTDITAMKQLEASQYEKEATQESLAYVRSIVDTVREPLLVLDAEMKIVSASRSFCQTFQVIHQEIEKQLLYELGNGQWDIPELRRLLEGIFPKSTQFNDYRVEHDFPEIGRKVMLLNARRILREGVGMQMILLAIEDVTERDKKR